MARRKIPDRPRMRFASASRPPFLDLLAERVRDARRDFQLRQDEVADIAGASLSFVRDLEAGKPSLRLDRVLEVLDVLGMTLAVAMAAPRRSGGDAIG